MLGFGALAEVALAEIPSEIPSGGFVLGNFPGDVIANDHPRVRALENSIRDRSLKNFFGRVRTLVNIFAE